MILSWSRFNELKIVAESIDLDDENVADGLSTIEVEMDFMGRKRLKTDFFLEQGLILANGVSGIFILEEDMLRSEETQVGLVVMAVKLEYLSSASQFFKGVG